jgi:hypothetical protein
MYTIVFYARKTATIYTRKQGSTAVGRLWQGGSDALVWLNPNNFERGHFAR